VLTAAFDESGSHADSRYIIIAGYVAPVERWELFAKRWVPALRELGVRPWPALRLGHLPPDPFFHMTDYESRQKQFQGWSQLRRIRLFRRLAGLIDQFTVLGFGVSVDRAAYAKIIAPQVPEASGYRDPYMWCMQSCMEALYHAKRGSKGLGSLRIVDPQPIACVFEQGHLVQGKVALFYARFREKWEADDVFGTFAFDTKQRFVPLQAADILAYEVRKDIENRGVRPRRRSLERLLRANTLTHGVFGEGELVRTAARVKALSTGEPDDQLALITDSGRPA